DRITFEVVGDNRQVGTGRSCGFDRGPSRGEQNIDGKVHEFLGQLRQHFWSAERPAGFQLNGLTFDIPDIAQSLSTCVISSKCTRPNPSPATTLLPLCATARHQKQESPSKRASSRPLA